MRCRTNLSNRMCGTETGKIKRSVNCKWLVCFWWTRGCPRRPLLVSRLPDSGYATRKSPLSLWCSLIYGKFGRELTGKKLHNETRTAQGKGGQDRRDWLIGQSTRQFGSIVFWKPALAWGPFDLPRRTNRPPLSVRFMACLERS
jgi:hypothetical protein